MAGNIVMLMACGLAVIMKWEGPWNGNATNKSRDPKIKSFENNTGISNLGPKLNIVVPCDSNWLDIFFCFHDKTDDLFSDH